MRARIAAGVVVLAVMVWIGAGMLPPYFRDLEFQSYLNDLAGSPQLRAAPVELVATRVAGKAASMDIPLKFADVKVLRLGDRLRIELKYVVPVDLGIYSVDLHFRAAVGPA